MKIGRSYTFEAAHYLPGVPESHKCKRVHGHSYRLELALQGKVDPVSGFVIDFFDLDARMHSLLQKLDHHLLNDVIPNPTAENIAIWVWDQVYPQWSPVEAFFKKVALTMRLRSVRVYETPECWAEYNGR